MSAWQPDQYHRFADQRRAPFFDLLALVRPIAGGRGIDLGCGTGELTLVAHERTEAAETVGVDNSPEMLAQAPAATGVTFRSGDIGAFGDPGAWDLVISNAALHWVPDHADVLGRWAESLRPGGQLAVQVPANADHPSHRISAEVAASAEFAGLFAGSPGAEPPADPVLSVLRPEEYAVLLDHLGFEEQHVRLQVYGHRLASTTEVVEWVKGTSLTRFRQVLDEATYERFVARYRERLLIEVGDHRPYFYAFKRILMWGRRP